MKGAQRKKLIQCIRVRVLFPFGMNTPKEQNAIMLACEANRMRHVATESVSKLWVTPAPGLLQCEDVFTGISVGYATLGAILSRLYCNHGRHGRQTSESEPAERKLHRVRTNTYQLFWHNNEQWRQAFFVSWEKKVMKTTSCWYSSIS